MHCVDHHPARGHRLLLVGEERDPARQVRVLRADDRGVAVVHQLQRPARDRIDPSGAGGRSDDQHLTLQGAAAFELADQQRHSGLVGIGRLQTHIDPDRLFGRPPVDPGQLGRAGSGSDEVAALISQRVPCHEGLWAAGALGALRLDHAFPRCSVLRLKHLVGTGQETTQQHTVGQRDHQHHNDGGTDEQRHLVVHMPAADEEACHRLDDVQQHPGGSHASGADRNGDHQGAQIAGRTRALDPHQRRHLTLPFGGGNQHQHRGRDTPDHRDRLQRVRHRRGRRPPASTRQHEPAHQFGQEHP